MDNTEQQAVPVAQETLAQPGFVVWHSSEEDGGPDVGITVGLGDGKMLWIGERSSREGDGMGLLVYGDQAIDANASLGEYDEIRDLIEQHVAPALSRLAATSLHDMQITPALSLPCKSGEGAGELALSKAVRITAYDRKDPLAIRLEFADDADRVSAADEIDEILSDAFTAARARMVSSLDEARERRGGRLIPVRRAALTPDATQTREAEGVHWRTDVEAAPRDGTRIILMWHDHESLSPHVELGKMGCGGKGWCNTYGHAFTGEPTHWMPLPDAGSAVLNARGGA